MFLVFSESLLFPWQVDGAFCVFVYNGNVKQEMSSRDYYYFFNFLLFSHL
jgi:hypothetical protein